MTFEYLGYQVIQDEEDYRSLMLLRDEKEVMHARYIDIAAQKRSCLNHYK